MGFPRVGDADRLVRHESGRRTMAHVADHLSVSALEEAYRSCRDVTAARHVQTIWLWARGHDRGCRRGDERCAALDRATAGPLQCTRARCPGRLAPAQWERAERAPP